MRVYINLCVYLCMSRCVDVCACLHLEVSSCLLALCPFGFVLCGLHYSNRPYLNGYKHTDECQAVYVSTQDEMCATSIYAGDREETRCGLILTDTSDLRVRPRADDFPSTSCPSGLSARINRSLKERE